MNKKLVSFSLLSLGVILTGCGSNGEAGSDNNGEGNNGGESGNSGGSSEELQLGHVWPESELHAEATEKFAEEVEELTDGELSIDIHGDGTLGDDTELLEGLKVGSTDIWVGGAGVLTSEAETAEIFTVPFMFESHEHANTVYNGEIGEEISNNIKEESGYEVMSYWARGARWLTANEPVETPEDLSGLSIRVPDNPVFTESFEQMGASPTSMSFGEVFTALQQGTIDGQENPLSLIYNSQFQEVQDYLIKTEHVREPISVVMNEETVSSLSEEHQEALKEAAEGTAKEFAEEEVVSSEEEYMNTLQEEGMELVEPEKAEFQNTLDGFVEEDFPHLENIYEDIRAANPE